MRTVWLLAFISFFTDIASEMLYPVLPLYLPTLGFSVTFLGILEGIAEATASLSKGFFGRLSDVVGKRLPFIQIGYLLSALAKPLMIAIANPLWVLLCRTADRLGKGVRTAARDALLAAQTTVNYRGRVFGLHRAMDTLGATLGPLLALGWLWYSPSNYQALFFFSLVPGICAVILTLFLKEKPLPAKTSSKIPWGDFLHYYKTASKPYQRTVSGLLLFALFTSSPVFLLLLLKWRGFLDQQVLGFYLFYNLVYALFAYPMGKLGDVLGLKKTFLAGVIVFLLVYTTIPFCQQTYLLLCLFFTYGIYAAMTEGIAKAWLTTLCPPEESATAIGTYTAFASLATMAANLVAGLLWQWVAVEATFLVAAIGASLAGLYLKNAP